MTTKMFGALGVALLIAWLAVSWTRTARSATEIQLLETGEFHGDEVNAKTGEQWLGLFPTRAGFSLLPSTIAVDAVHDSIVDEDPNQKSGKKVSVSADTEPIFLVKGATMLRPGKAVTVFKETKSLGNLATVTLQLEGKEYQLSVVSPNPEPLDCLAQDTKLLLTFEGTTQVLISLEEHDEAGWSLIWAGDIDGDGKLDLYMDLSNHYNVSDRKLFLSSQAGPTELLKNIATFRTSGC